MIRDTALQYLPCTHDAGARAAPMGDIVNSPIKRLIVAAADLLGDQLIGRVLIYIHNQVRHNTCWRAGWLPAFLSSHSSSSNTHPSISFVALLLRFARNTALLRALALCARTPYRRRSSSRPRGDSPRLPACRRSCSSSARCLIPRSRLLPRSRPSSSSGSIKATTAPWCTFRPVPTPSSPMSSCNRSYAHDAASGAASLLHIRPIFTRGDVRRLGPSTRSSSIGSCGRSGRRSTRPIFPASRPMFAWRTLCHKLPCLPTRVSRCS